MVVVAEQRRTRALTRALGLPERSGATGPRDRSGASAASSPALTTPLPSTPSFFSLPSTVFSNPLIANINTTREKIHIPTKRRPYIATGCFFLPLTIPRRMDDTLAGSIKPYFSDVARLSFCPHAVLRQAVTLELHIKNIRKVPRQPANVAVPFSRIAVSRQRFFSRGYEPRAVKKKVKGLHVFEA